MSILQEYEQIKLKIGKEKYSAINLYLKEKCPQKNYEKYEQELKKIWTLPPDQWSIKDQELKKKNGVIFLSDILYKKDEWDKYNKWYNKEYKHKKLNRAKNIER